MCFQTVLKLVLVLSIWMDVASTAPRRRSVNSSDSPVEYSSPFVITSNVKYSDANLRYDELNHLGGNENIISISSKVNEKQKTTKEVAETVESNENNNELVRLIEEQLDAKGKEIVEISEVRAEVYDVLAYTETAKVFPVEIDQSSLVGYIFTDHAANEMIARLDGDIKVFEEMRQRIHYLEENMNKHKYAHLVDNDQIKDAETILKVMDKDILIPFGINLESIKEQIIKMDHSLKGDALDYVKELTERAKAYIIETKEKLDIVVEADKEWTHEENSFDSKQEGSVIAVNDDASTKEEASSINIPKSQLTMYETAGDAVEISNGEFLHESIKEDAASKYKKGKNIKKIKDYRRGKKINKNYFAYPNENIELEKMDLGLLNKVKEQLDNANVVTTEQALVNSDIEDNLSKESKVHVGKEVGNGALEGSESNDVTGNNVVMPVETDRKINPKIKLILENAKQKSHQFLHENLTAHKHEPQSGSSGMPVWLPFLILVPLLAILGGLFAFGRMKRKEMLNTHALNSWRNYYPCDMENVSTIKKTNYYKLK